MRPRRFQLSQHKDFGYRVSMPNLLPDHGDRLAVREDIITEADVEAVALWLSKWRFETYAEQAREVLALVLGSDKEGEDE